MEAFRAPTKRMGEKELMRVIGRYRRYFEENGIPKSLVRDDARGITHADALAHCHTMLDDIEGFSMPKNLGKAFRWLGFVQGVLAVYGVYTIAEMREHNRPS